MSKNIAVALIEIAQNVAKNNTLRVNTEGTYYTVLLEDAEAGKSLRAAVYHALATINPIFPARSVIRKTTGNRSGRDFYTTTVLDAVRRTVAQIALGFQLGVMQAEDGTVVMVPSSAPADPEADPEVLTRIENDRISKVDRDIDVWSDASYQNANEQFNEVFSALEGFQTGDSEISSNEDIAELIDLLHTLNNKGIKHALNSDAANPEGASHCFRYMYFDRDKAKRLARDEDRAAKMAAEFSGGGSHRRNNPSETVGNKLPF